MTMLDLLSGRPSSPVAGTVNQRRHPTLAQPVGAPTVWRSWYSSRKRYSLSRPATRNRRCPKSCRVGRHNVTELPPPLFVLCRSRNGCTGFELQLRETKVRIYCVYLRLFAKSHGDEIPRYLGLKSSGEPKTRDFFDLRPVGHVSASPRRMSERLRAVAVQLRHRPLAPQKITSTINMLSPAAGHVQTEWHST